MVLSVGRAWESPPCTQKMERPMRHAYGSQSKVSTSLVHTSTMPYAGIGEEEEEEDDDGEEEVGKEESVVGSSGWWLGSWKSL